MRAELATRIKSARIAINEVRISNDARTAAWASFFEVDQILVWVAVAVPTDEEPWFEVEGVERRLD
jgi:hypothetical protein